MQTMPVDFETHENSIMALFKSREDAERAYNVALAHGYNTEEVNVILTDKTNNKYFLHRIPAATSNNSAGDDYVLEGLAIGSAVGGTFSALTLITAITAMDIDLFILGAGLAIGGPVAVILAGALGCVGGGLLGAIVGTGITHNHYHAKIYEKFLRDDNITLSINLHSEKDLQCLEDEWKKYHAEIIQH